MIMYIINDVSIFDRNISYPYFAPIPLVAIVNTDVLLMVYFTQHCVICRFRSQCQHKISPLYNFDIVVGVYFTQY